MSSQPNSNYNNQGGGEVGAWIFTIIMLWVFFPVGVVMLICKLRDAFRQDRGVRQRDWQPGRPMTQNAPPPRKPGQPMTQNGWQPAQPAAQEETQWQPVQPVSQTPQPERPPQAAQPRRAERNRGQALEPVGKSVKLLRLFGIVLIIVGLAGMREPLEWLFWMGFDLGDLYSVLQWLAVALGGGAMLAVAGRRSRRESLYHGYQNVIGASQMLSLDFIASAMGRRYDDVVEDLQDMIRRGYFGPESYLDLYERAFVACHAAAPRREVRAEEPAAPQSPASGMYDEERQICEINRRIGDRHVTECMNRLEELTHKIFAYVEEHPEKEGRIRKFRAHYLPKTIKICEAYARFEQQGVAGGNIQSAMEEVEATMDSLVKGFENQLDMLFDDEALDISTDISVLESMMAPSSLKIVDFMPREKAE